MTQEITLLQAVVYGVVQGLTEWLPISSTAHLRVIPALCGWQDPGSAFTAVIQLGTILAVLIYFAKDLGRAIGGWFGSLTGKGKDTVEAKIGWGVFWGTFPIVVLGFLFKDQIKSDQIRSLYVVSTTLIVMGVGMLLAEKFGKQSRGFDQVTTKDGIVMGLWQALALIPGMSRSGSTITGGLFSGLDRPTAARFSFLLSVPSIVAAGLYELIDERKHIMGANLAPTLVATVVSFLVGYASIAFLMKYLQRRGITLFVVYRIALGIVLLILVQQKIVPAVQASPDQGKADVSQKAP
ncbi:MAG: undecaprenyl-diphosphate phosphatase [Fimbriimonas sp.]